jgi:hypothetical protein
LPNDKNLLFYGKIKENGKCEIRIPALKEFEESSGTVILEIIADSTYFESWRDTFELETNKKVTVEMVEKSDDVLVEKKIVPHVQIIEPKDENKTNRVNNIEGFKKFVTEKKISLTEIVKDKDKYLKLLMEYKKQKSLDKKDVVKIHEEIVAHYINKLI